MALITSGLRLEEATELIRTFVEHKISDANIRMIIKHPFLASCIRGILSRYSEDRPQDPILGVFPFSEFYDLVIVSSSENRPSFVLSYGHVARLYTEEPTTIEALEVHGATLRLPFRKGRHIPCVAVTTDFSNSRFETDESISTMEVSGLRDSMRLYKYQIVDKEL